MSGKTRLSAKQKKVIKSNICEILEKSPIIESACQKVGISRMTLSRWRKSDPKFNQTIEDVLMVSRSTVNDLAESKMIQKINEGNPSMIRFWLANNSDRYKKQSKAEIKQLQPIVFNTTRSPFMTGELKKNKAPSCSVCRKSILLE